MDKSIEETRRRRKRQVVRISTIRDTIMNYKKTPFYKTKSISDKKGQEIAPSVRDSALSQNDNTDKSELPINFDNYDFSVFLNKKTEKLTVALYMVTSFLSDNEPLKWRLREKSIVLLSGITTARDKSVSEMENVFASHSFLVEEIISFLEVGAASKLISEMNFSILKKEYLLLKHFIDSNEHMDEKSGKAAFSNNFFHVDEKEIKKKDSSIINNVDALGIKDRGFVGSEKNSKGQIMYKRQASNIATASVPGTLKQRNFSGDKGTRLGATPRTIKDIKSERLNRRDSILKLFKTNKGKKLTIKDISHHISTCSEKTIQRELTTLVLVGVLNKDGERRWSKYSLK